MEKYSEHEAATFVFPKADFSLNGTYFCEYHKKLPEQQAIYYPQGNTADLSIIGKSKTPCWSVFAVYFDYHPTFTSVCKSLFLCLAVKLEKPSLYLTSGHVPVVYSPHKISVIKGSAFTITCSIHSRYPEGVFYLTRSNKNVTAAKPTLGYSIFYLTYFEFPEIDFKDEGEYACVYRVNISSVPFNSLPSNSLYVSISGKT